MELTELHYAPDEVCLTGNVTGALRTHNHRVSGRYTYTEAMTTDLCFPYYFPKGYGPPQDYGLYPGWVPFEKRRLTDGFIPTAVSWPLYWASFIGRDVTLDLGKEYEITRVIVKATWQGIGIVQVFLKSPGEKVYTLVATSFDLVAFSSGQPLERTEAQEFKNISQPARWARIQQQVRLPGYLAEIEMWGREIKEGGASEARSLPAGGR